MSHGARPSRLGNQRGGSQGGWHYGRRRCTSYFRPPSPRSRDNGKALLRDDMHLALAFSGIVNAEKYVSARRRTSGRTSKTGKVETFSCRDWTALACPLEISSNAQQAKQMLRNSVMHFHTNHL